MSASGSDSSSMDGEVMRAFWAVELEPGKEYTTAAPYDLHITSAVLPASAKDNGRSVVSLSFDEEPTAISLVSLKLDHNESQLLNVMIDEGSTFKFTVTGKNHVHLSGFYVPDSGSPYDDDEVDSDMGEEDDFSESMLESDNDEDELSESSKDTTKQIIAALQNNAEKKRKAQPGAQNGDASKKAKAEPAAKAPNTPAAKPAQQEGKKAQTPQQQQKTQQQKTPTQQQKPQGQKSPQQQEKEIAGGLKYTVTTAGHGAEATFGRKVSMRYVGKFTHSGKIFDKSAKPFSFRLGAGDVIAGWDKGIIGMKEGEKRTLVIPPELAYGKRGAGKEIPPNSWLTFDVELVTVK